MKKAVFGLATSDEQARRIVDRLLAAGFTNSDISVLFPDNKNTVRTTDSGRVVFEEFPNQKTSKNGSLTTEKHTKAPEGGVVGATTGGILGGSLGLLVGIGALAIPGLGPFIAAGPIVAAISGSAVGGSLGLLIGALVGAGIPEYEAKRYEEGLRAGNILVSVHAENSEEATEACDIMKKEGAKDISTSMEKTKSNR